MNFWAEVCAEARSKRKRANNLTLSGRLKNVFSGKQLGLVQEETLVVFYTRMPRETVRTTWNEAKTRKKFSSISKHPLQYRRWKTQTDGKSLNSPNASPVTEAENSLTMVDKMKISSCYYRHHPVCRGYESGNRCIHGYRCLRRQADGKSSLSARSKRRCSRISWYPEKKAKVVYLKTRRQWILFYRKLKNWDWTLRRDTPEILRMHLVQNWIRGTKGQSGGIIQKGEPHERNPCVPDFGERPPEETSWQAECDSKAAWNLARKDASLSRTCKLRFNFLVKAPETQKRVCLLCIRELQCTMLSIEN